MSSFAVLTGEVSGVFREEFAEPLDLDFWIGLPKELEPRVPGGHPDGVTGPEGLDLEGIDLEGIDMSDVLGADSLMMRALTLNGAFEDLVTLANTREFRAVELPAANGVTNARSLARLYAGLIGPVDGGPSTGLLTPTQVDIAREPQATGTDLVLSLPGIAVDSTIGAGFYCSSTFAPMGGSGAFGHHGAGGSLGFADPDHHLAGGYVMNRMGLGDIDPRPTRLVRASYEAAGAPIAFG